MGSRDGVGFLGNFKISVITEDRPTLVMTIEPGAPGDILTLAMLQEILEENGAKDWFLNREQVRLLREELHSLTVAKSYAIAECRDAEVRVGMSDDHKQAWITIVPAFGGARVTAGMIAEALKSAGVTYGILDKKIADLVARGACEDELIAQATLPIPGTDASFERLFQESDHKGQPRVDKEGKVDLHDLGLFVSVVKGTVLIRRIPPSPGIPGVAVDGELIPPQKPRDRGLSPGIGTGISKEDPNVLVATADGLPVFTENSVKIVSKLELGGLDYETGNVEFVGSMLIRGSVQPGFSAKAGGDIVIDDTVDASDITASGSINLHCGVFGRGRSQINAKGNVRARFLSDCKIYCGGNLEVDDLIANCTVICEGTVEVGQRWGKGQIYGGRILATKGVRAKILGSVLEANTVIEVSPSPLLAARERTVVSEIEELEHRVVEVSHSLAYLQCSAARQRDPRLVRLTKEHQDLRCKLDSLKAELQELSAKLRVRFDARISALQVYPGVVVSIGRKHEAIAVPMEHFLFEPSQDWDLPMASGRP